MIRSKLLKTVYNLDQTLGNHDDDHLIHILLYGSQKFNFTEHFDESLIGNICFIMFYFIFSICYYYQHYCFIASCLWFLTCIYSNTFFGLRNLEFFIESLYASIYVYSFYSFLFFSLSLFSFFLFSFFFNYFFIFYYYNYYNYYNCLCLCVLYVYRPCWETSKIPSGFWVLLCNCIREFFYFRIVELWVLVNLKYRKKKWETRKIMVPPPFPASLLIVIAC